MQEDAIEELAAKWLAGWNIRDRPFNGEVFRSLFAPGDGALSVFDNVQGDVIVLRDVDQYVETWGPFMEPMTHWAVTMEDFDLVASGELAVSTFKLVGVDTRGPAGEKIAFGQYGTHVWRHIEGLGWRIIHEHLTSYKQGQEQSR